MTHDEMRSAIELIAGGAGHGMIKAAAARLDRSTRTITDAYKNGRISADLAECVRAELQRLDARDAETGLFAGAGVWSVGHVESRRDGRDVVDESVVTHIKNPVFIMHVVMKRGKGPAGEAIFEESVRWCDEPSSDARRAELLAAARERGRQALYERSAATATTRMLEHHREKAQRHSALSSGELAALSYRGLVTEGCGVDISERVAELNEMIGEKFKEYLQLGEEMRRAARLGEELGALKSIYKMASVAMIDAPQSPMPAYIAARAYDLLPLARRGTARRDG